MKVNGSRIHRLVRVVEYKFGQMDQCMKDTGLTIRPTVKVDSSMLMEMYMMDTGKMINNMEKVLKHGQTVQVTRVSTLKEENMEGDVSHGLIIALTLETSLKTILKVKVSYSNL